METIQPSTNQSSLYLQSPATNIPSQSYHAKHMLIARTPVHSSTPSHIDISGPCAQTRDYHPPSSPDTYLNLLFATQVPRLTRESPHLQALWKAIACVRGEY